MSIIEFLANTNLVLFSSMGVNAQEVHGYKMINSGGKAPFFNGVMHVDISNPEFNHVVNTAQEYFRKNRLPYSIWVAETGKDSPEKKPLQPEGMKFVGEHYGMVLDIDKAIVPKNVSDIEIVPVMDLETHKKWNATLSKAFGIDDEVASFYGQLILKGGFNGPFYHLSGKIDGKIICTGSVLCTPEGAYIYNVTTDKEERCKGYASALVYELVQLAKDKGIARIGLVAFPESVNFYSDLGFQKVFPYNVYIEEMADCVSESLFIF